MCGVPVCDGEPLVVPVTIPAGGVYHLQLDFLNGMLVESAEFIATNTATFSKELLNENFTYTGWVVNSSGEKVPFTIDDEVYDCFEFTTHRQTQTVTADES